MPRKRKSYLSQSFNKARAMKVAGLNETFPQAELQKLEPVEHETAHRAAETPEQSQARHQQNANIWHLNGILRHLYSPKLGVFSRRLTWRLKEIQRPLKQLNLSDSLLLKGHNSDV
ncbi:hypothetical protein TNCV_3376041 [Trichonephila clavipes]|nr:hypothetical protein TNCV_3376041 [Trichonephila clavipes]